MTFTMAQQADHRKAFLKELHQKAWGGRCNAAKGLEDLIMSGKVTRHVECSPAAATRCKSGQEGTECHCACAGQNHGLYQTIPNFDGQNDRICRHPLKTQRTTPSSK
jgi:hypothetical protein